MHELTGAEEQVEQMDYLMTQQWDLDVHSTQNAFGNDEVLNTISDFRQNADYLASKRENAKYFGSELDDLRIAQGDQTVLEQRQQKLSEVPSYMYDDDSFKNLSVAPITGSEESLGGYNALQLESQDNDE